ncbi:JM48 [macacine gammaherpesvirus 11]|uniref:JM48 n=2 Tax=macacine gammaherpesvirus 11 TaxID=2560570 RepID=G9JM56_9GAMA|nr:JM48 [Macaca fuscata rhadinovirus]AAT00025.1 JM48 [Macaca fuscata rhadinovirus]AEW87573.1 JM48 [Macaca fuscata rhadinovirus]AEW87743.1 JM48 [Macaca fuscata rhadinovirus]
MTGIRTLTSEEKWRTSSVTWLTFTKPETTRIMTAATSLTSVPLTKTNSTWRCWKSSFITWSCQPVPTATSAAWASILTTWPWP